MKMNTKYIENIIESHAAWLRGDGGTRADLSEADLTGAELRGANLSKADLRRAKLAGAKLSWANLSGADLSGTDLTGADLSDADLGGTDLSDADLGDADLGDADLSGAVGLLCPIQWVADNLERAANGWIAYKTFGELQPTPAHWVLEPGAEIRENVDANRASLYGCGVNVATLDCVRTNMHGAIWRVLIPFEAGPSVVVPYNTDGKIRVGMVRLLERVKR